MRSDQSVLYVTERCVFRLVEGEMVLTEVAPGIDLERDILSCMDFIPHIASELKTMDGRIFRDVWNGLFETLGD